MTLNFTKMQGAGNDYIYINCLEGNPVLHPEKLSAVLSDRRFGIGGDGIVLILPSGKADFRMRIFNADGSEAEICGNAARCVGRYLYDKGLTGIHDSTPAGGFLLETGAGIRRISYLSEDCESGSAVGGCRGVPAIQVDMGFPVFFGEEGLYVADDEGSFQYRGIQVSMGNPHLVIFTDEITDRQVLEHGPFIEKHRLFPEGTNVEFVRIIDRENLRFRVWERGSGETLSCGSGACAVFAVARRSGFCGSRVVCSAAGGDLLLNEMNDGSILLSGPAEVVFEGRIEL